MTIIYVLSPKYEVFSLRSKWAAGKALAGAYLIRDTRPPINAAAGPFSSHPPGRGHWLFSALLARPV